MKKFIINTKTVESIKNLLTVLRENGIGVYKVETKEDTSIITLAEESTLADKFIMTMGYMEYKEDNEIKFNTYKYLIVLNNKTIKGYNHDGYANRFYNKFELKNKSDRLQLVNNVDDDYFKKGEVRRTKRLKR